MIWVELLSSFQWYHLRVRLACWLWQSMTLSHMHLSVRNLHVCVIGWKLFPSPIIFAVCFAVNLPLAVMVVTMRKNFPLPGAMKLILRICCSKYHWCEKHCLDWRKWFDFFSDVGWNPGYFSHCLGCAGHLSLSCSCLGFKSFSIQLITFVLFCLCSSTMFHILRCWLNKPWTRKAHSV